MNRTDRILTVIICIIVLIAVVGGVYLSNQTETRRATEPEKVTTISWVTSQPTLLGIFFETENGVLRQFNVDPNHGKIKMSDNPCQIIWYGGNHNWSYEELKEIQLNRNDPTCTTSP